MVEPRETKVKAKEGEKKKFPKFKKRSTTEKTTVQQNALNETC